MCWFVCEVGWFGFILLNSLKYRSNSLKYRSKKMPVSRPACMTLEDRKAGVAFCSSICVWGKSCWAGSGVVFCSRGGCVEFARVSLTVHQALWRTVASLRKAAAVPLLREELRQDNSQAALWRVYSVSEGPLSRQAEMAERCPGLVHGGKGGQDFTRIGKKWLYFLACKWQPAC